VEIAHEGFWIPEFRTLHDEFIPVPDPSDPRRVNVLLGRNGSGKSSLLEALRRLRDWSAADERWGRSAVAAFRVGAHFDGRETWHGEPRSQMDSLKWHLTSRDTLRESSIEDYVNGDPRLRHRDQFSSPEEVAKELEDPVPEQRKQFAELFGESLEDQLGEGGSDQRRRPFTFEKWLVAAAALRPAELEYLFHYDSLNLGIRIRLGELDDPPAEEWIVRELHGDTWTGWGNGDERFLIQARALQRSFFHQVDRWVSQVASALGDDLAGALVRSFLNRPLVLVGTAANERAAGFPAFFGLGLLTKDVDDEVASALDAGDPEISSSALVTSLVKQWQSGSPIITIAHPSTRDAPVDLAQVRESPINWSTFHEVGLPRLPEDDTWFTLSEDPLEPPDIHEDPRYELVSREWEADLRPSALMPSIIFTTPQPEGLVGYLEEHLPVLHDQVFFSSPFMRTGRKPSKAKNEHPGGLGQQLAEAGYFYPIRPNQLTKSANSVADGWCVSGGALGLLPAGEGFAGPEGEGAVSLVVRGSVKSIARMISHRANQLAPGFLRLEGWIALKVTSPADWAEGGPRISVRLVRSVDADTRKEHFTELGHLSDGLARWVALVVRLAVTDLQESRWEVPVNVNHEVSADSTVESSNLPGFGTQVTAKEYTPSLGEVVSGLSIEYVNKSVDRDWFLFAAMEEPWRLIESTDEANSWKNTLILIDEPEVHLHLGAQRSVRDWIGGISAGAYRAVDPLWTENATGSTRYVIVASHSPIFLDYPPDTARTTFVYAETAVEPREPTSLKGFDETTDPEHDNIPVTDGTQKIRTVLTPVPEGEDIFQFFKGEQGKRLGTSGIDVIALYSGFIIVEGSQDETILEHFYGTELKERRIGLLRAWGTRNAEAADLLTYIGKPVAILVDRAELGPGEKAAVNAFVRSCVNRKLPHWPDHGQAGGHPYPDIIAALPDDAVRAAFPNSTFNGWNPIVDEFEQMRRQRITTGNFKPFATERMGMDISTADLTKRFIKPVLKECGDETRPREGLELVMNDIISFMANPKADIESDDFDDEPF
jgi:hypothetical protein